MEAYLGGARTRVLGWKIGSENRPGETETGKLEEWETDPYLTIVGLTCPEEDYPAQIHPPNLDKT